MLKKSKVVALLVVCMMMFAVVEPACAESVGAGILGGGIGAIGGGLLGLALFGPIGAVIGAVTIGTGGAIQSYNDNGASIQQSFEDGFKEAAYESGQDLGNRIANPNQPQPKYTPQPKY